MMISLTENYYLLQGLVIATLSVVLIGLSWVFMRYAAQPVPISFTKLCQAIGSGALVVFAAVVINKLYPLSFFKVVVPAFLCAAVVHSIIIIFNLHVQYRTQQTLLKFPKFMAVCINYVFFAIVSLLVMYQGGASLETFFYYLTEACIKIGVVVILYLLLRNEGIQLGKDSVRKMIVEDAYDFFGANNDNEVR